MEKVCFRCGKALTADEIGIYRKMVSRGADKFLCIDCLSADFKIEKRKLYEMIERFRADGCMAF